MEQRDFATRLPGEEEVLFSLLSGQHRFEKHTHDTYSIGIMLSGYSHFIKGKERELLHPGRVFLVNPEEVHNCECGTECDQWVYANIYPGTELMQNLYAEMGGNPDLAPVFPHVYIDDLSMADDLQRLFGKILANLEALELETELIDVLSRLIVKHANKEGKRLSVFDEISPKEIARVLEYLEHVEEPEKKSVAELAAVAGFSPYHFIRTFRKTVGMTPYAYASQLRVIRARRLLLDGVSISETAQQSGFSDQSHMTREFKKIFGVTPGKFRL